MSSGEGAYEEESLEVGEGYAGEAQAASEQGAFSEEAPMSEEEFDELQERFGVKRRRGGPDLHAETLAREEADEEVPDVEPTETEEAETERPLEA